MAFGHLALYLEGENEERPDPGEAKEEKKEELKEEAAPVDHES
jgi:hypothetical protein